ncbi:DUF3325 domain-containing protein [Pseudothauera rhizosphaerae]|uniref:DUF3325 domain-containing protein n=1 Tax=Pseudothauera rhizosphaerae TaxID=2565932 RepID=A0A4S4ARX6_9RHOO|nr:DUF3325 domain-containing protein [Pseudothauera rhizosphaerae]THF62613.1 DUF3325 domain-containing protein [Pseudothauera rhizosphaerae]
MMPDLHFGWHLAVLALSLGGFALLALASEREGTVLLRRPASAAERRVFRWLGWPLLGLALALCAWGWLAHFGTVLWLGWLSVAAVVLVFTIAYWPWRKKREFHGRPRKTAEIIMPPAVASPWMGLTRGAGWFVLAAAPLAFGWQLWQAEPWPVLRADAVRGEIGPWRYRLAEEEREAPEVLASGAAVKHFVLRLEGDELAVARAWLRVQPPRSLRTAGMAFDGNHGNREAMLVIPPSATAQDTFWLTVQGKNGQIYRAEIDMRRLSPATAAFVEGQR